MELKSMKMSDGEQKEYTQPTTITGGEAPAYPYGLCISMDEESLKKLGLQAGKLTVGQAVMVHAAATVKSISLRMDEKEKHESVDMQLTDMAVELGKAAEQDGEVSEGRSAESVLYAGAKNDKQDGTTT